MLPFELLLIFFISNTSLLCIPVNVCNCTDLGYCYMKPETRQDKPTLTTTIAILAGVIGFCSKSESSRESNKTVLSPCRFLLVLLTAFWSLFHVSSCCSHHLHHSDQKHKQREQEESPDWRRREERHDVETHTHIKYACQVSFIYIPQHMKLKICLKGLFCISGNKH